MDAADRDARRLPVALWSAAGRLRRLAYDLFLEHQPHIGWSEFAKYGGTPGMRAAASPCGYRYLPEIPEVSAGSLGEHLPLIESQVDQLTEAAPHFLRELRAGA